MNVIAILCYVFALSTTQTHLTSTQQRDVLQEAQIAYDQGISLLSFDPVAANVSFRRSTDRFELLINDGVENGRLWFNLGNAHLQAGNIGRSIAAYRSAQRHIPTNSRLTANLDYARSLVHNPIEDTRATSLLRRLVFWHKALPTRVRLVACIAIWSICWVFLSIRLFTRFPCFKTGITMLGSIAIVLGISVTFDIADQHQDYGVIIAHDVIIRKGHGTNYTPLFKEPIDAGIEFELIEERRNWIHIRLPNGLQGWIKEDAAQVVSSGTFEPTT